MKTTLAFGVLFCFSCGPLAIGDGSGWVDADGEPLDVLESPLDIADRAPTQYQEQILYHFDARGYVWVIDVRTGISRPVVLSARPGFASSDCNGDGWILSSRQAPPPPRYTFRLDDLGPIHARADDAPEEVVAICSLKNEAGSCDPRTSECTDDYYAGNESGRCDPKSVCGDYATAPLAGSLPDPPLEVPAPRPAPLRPVWGHE